MVLSNETILIEQCANNKGHGRGIKGAKPPRNWNTSSLWTFNGSRKFPCFL